MSVPRLATVVAVLLGACAGWETTTQYTPPPPAEGPTPSHVSPDAPYTPPPPVTAIPPLPEPPHVEIKVAIASVQLLEDCPDPAPAAEPAGAREMSAKWAGARGDVASGRSRFDRSCTQSTVQLALRSDVPGSFRVEAARVLDAKSLRPIGTASLRGPTRWSEGDSRYMPWDERVDVKSELKISYKLGALDRVGGSYVLELEVSVDGHRQTIRSPEFVDEPPHMMVT